jgi:NAD(P)-dependent dehydrogenase (short-subunit alcohol dehydrogenase family)
MSEFHDRVVLITGAGSGIGRQLARLLSAEGARIAGVDLQPQGLAELTAELQGKPVATTRVDVTDLAALRSAVAELEGRLGPTDLLIACAGIGRKTAASPLMAEEINAHIQVNLVGVVNSIDSVLAGMQQRRRGHLVALSSLASYRGLPLMAGYCASKAGVNALLDALRVELRESGIAVTTVCPGWVRTPMTAPLRLPRRELMDVDRAAEVILKAIRRRAPFVAFPPRLVWQLRLLRYLPRPIGDWLAHKQMARARRLLVDG